MRRESIDARRLAAVSRLVPACFARSVARRHALIAALVLAAPLVHGQQTEPRQTEELFVLGEDASAGAGTVSPRTQASVDTAELLQRLPGADANPNGLLSGIAQYRGLYGDRVAVSIDGLPTVTGGPNAMDSPLSYASPLLLDQLTLERGIASVSSAVESLGGSMSVDYDRGSYADEADFLFDGKAQARYGSNGGMNSEAVQLVGASNAHKLALLAERDRSDDLGYPGGELTPTRLARDRYDLSYAYRHGDAQYLVYAGGLETSDTGTPALPMDIRRISTDLYGIRIDRDLGGRSSLDIAVSHSNVDHVMDNYALRTPPPSLAAFRSNHARGGGSQWRIGGRTSLENGEWQLGIDGETSEHTATITNPNAPAFGVDNFNSAERDILGVYAQWNRAQGPLDYEAGLRVNHVQTDSGPVSAMIPAMTPMMQMMRMNVSLLAAAFNGLERDRSRTNVDMVFKVGRAIGDTDRVYLEVARKTRAPSYQELYLWLPLEATGGLGDGRTYIGNPALDSEVSKEIDVGWNRRSEKTWFAPQLFYKDVSGYIQGVPSTNAIANAVSTAMSGRPALEFANTDAEIYGLDVAWGYRLSRSVVLDGVLSYVRGKRVDVDDNLYRLAPLHGRVSLAYEAEDWSARLDAVGYAAQNEVAAFNDELPTAGYGIVDASAQWSFRPGLSLSVNVLNALDKRYRSHLGGINRVAGVDVPTGDRLFGQGRSVQLGFSVEW
jgi:iron complex outermembrane receptor protein